MQNGHFVLVGVALSYAGTTADTTTPTFTHDPLMADVYSSVQSGDCVISILCGTCMQ